MPRCPATLALVLAACALAACATPRRAPLPGPQAGADTSTLYLVRRKWHIDVGFAAAEVSFPLNSVLGDFPEARYVFFGFGDRHYLMAKKRGAAPLIGALWPGPGLILTTAINGSPAGAFGSSQVLVLRVSSKQALDAQAFIWSSILSNGPSKRLKAEAPGPYEDSEYSSASTRYSALHTCNTWAAEALKSAGLPIRSRGVLFAGQLWSSARKLSLRHRAAASGACPVTAPAPRAYQSFSHEGGF